MQYQHRTDAIAPPVCCCPANRYLVTGLGHQGKTDNGKWQTLDSKDVPPGPQLATYIAMCSSPNGNHNQPCRQWHCQYSSRSRQHPTRRCAPNRRQRHTRHSDNWPKLCYLNNNMFPSHNVPLNLPPLDLAGSSESTDGWDQNY